MLTQEQEAKIFSVVCDVVVRAQHNWSVQPDDGLNHTSGYARAAALRVMDVIEEAIKDSEVCQCS